VVCKKALVVLSIGMITLLIATRNEHKVEEIRAILGNGYRYGTINDFPQAPEVVEDAQTFAGNATKKAVELAKWFSMTRMASHSGQSFVLADDSGLEVDALAGAPGVYSARFAAIEMGKSGNSSPADNNAKLLHLMKDVPRDRRSARFRCVVALTPILRLEGQAASPVCYADEFELATELFEGVCEGRIGYLPQGQGGFGYDPLFLPLGFEQTFADLPGEIKNRLSHRGMALGKLKQRLTQNHLVRPGTDAYGHRGWRP